MNKLLLLWLLSTSVYAQWDESFSTQVHSQLLIAGKRCLGGERSGVSERLCRNGQWLLTLDEVNRCSKEGCTEIYVPPFIAKLKKVEIITPSTISFFEVIPKDRISSKQRRMIGRYWVRFDLNAAPEVLRRHMKNVDENFYIYSLE